MSISPELPDETIRALAQRLCRSGTRDASGRPLDPTAPGFGGPVDTVVGRVGDPQPLFCTDLALAAAAPHRLLRGLALLALLRRATKIVLAIRADWWDALAVLRQRAASGKSALVPFAPCSPLGDQDLLCDLGAAADLQPDRSAVYDATTLVDVGAAIDGMPLGRRMVSVVGAIERPAVLEVPIGCSLLDLARACGCPPFGWIAYHNGIPDGQQTPVEATVGVDTRGVLVLPVRHPLNVEATTPAKDLARRCASACVNCRICTDICPVFLNGGQLQPHRVAQMVAGGWLDRPGEAEAGAAALQCRRCRLCDLACPSHLRPGRLVEAVGAHLEADGLRLAPSPTCDHGSYPLRPRAERQGRRMALQRVTAQLGLALYVAPPPSPRSFVPRRLSFELAPRAGGELRPLVEPGARIARGDPLARAADGVPLVSPIDGQIWAIDPDAGIVLDVA